jgi:hypothetical protein
MAVARAAATAAVVEMAVETAAAIDHRLQKPAREDTHKGT